MIEKERCICILNRQDQPLRMYSLKKMLEANGMRNYYNICLNRLIENECIDNEYVIPDYSNKDVAFTDDGIFICMDILESYISKEWLVKEWKDLKSINKNLKDMNLCLEAFRKMELKELLKILKIPATPEEESSRKAFKEVMLYLWLEFFSRFFLNKARLKVRNFILGLYIKAEANKIQNNS